MLRTQNGRTRLWIFVILLAVMAPMLTACYGRFQAVKSVYRFNADVSDDKLVRSAVMWGLLILPAYDFAALADLFVLNPIDYWKGTKIEVGSGSDPKGTMFALDRSEKTRGGTLTLSRAGQVPTKSVLFRTRDSEFRAR